jgi:hypothetical protein
LRWHRPAGRFFGRALVGRSAEEDAVSQVGSGPAILAEGLTKSFGDVRALRGIDLSVPHGTVLGVLGPNGAGKTNMGFDSSFGLMSGWPSRSALTSPGSLH